MEFKKFTLLFAFLFGASMAQAQELESYKSVSIGLDLGVNKSYTDITQYPLWPTLSDKADLQPSIGLHIRKSFSSVFGLQLNVGYDRLQGVLRPGGGDDKSKERIRQARIDKYFKGIPVYFQTPVMHFGIDAHVNISNIDVHYRANGHRKLLFYTLMGADMAFYNPQIKQLFGDADYTPVFSNNGGAKINQDNSYTILLRGGLGVKYNLNSKIDIGWEVVGNYATTDLLDGIDVKSNANDVFATSRFTLNFKLPSKTAGAEANLIDWMNPGQEIWADINGINQRLDSLSSVVSTAAATADADGDGIYDAVDKQPYTPFGAKVDAEGKGIDSDGDGVFDGIDKEENTPAGKLVNFQGIEIKAMSSDGGTGKSTIDPNAGKSINMDAYFPSLFFETGSARIRSMDIDKLVRVATALQQNSGLKVTVVGNADVRGGTEFNENLAKRRADAVRDYLVNNLGVDGGRIMVESKGESAPLSPNMNNVNRRVDIMGK